MSYEHVHPKVSQVICDALGRDAETLSLNARLIQDLGAESIDYLDIIFRLERAFGVKIPRGQIVKDARGDLSEEEFQRDGVVTEQGLDRLRKYLTEVPPATFKPGLKTGEIPTLFNVETFCKLVLRAQGPGTNGNGVGAAAAQNGASDPRQR